MSSQSPSHPSSLPLACYALSASALFLGGMLVQNMIAPTPVQAATISTGPEVSMATAKVQAAEDALFVISGSTLSVYRTNVANKKMDLVLSTKLGDGKGASVKGGEHAR